jgi:hypothetical protein
MRSIEDMKNEKGVLNISGKNYEFSVGAGGCIIATAEICNALRNSTDPWFSCVVGGFSFLGEGSGPYLHGDDKDPERRAEVVGELLIAGQFPTLEEAEEAGEAAISTEGYVGCFGDSYVIPERANMRFIPIP